MIRTPPSVRGGVGDVMALAWPAALNMMSITIMGIADTLFVGRIGSAEQGAVGFSHTVTLSINCFFMGTLLLVQTFTAQHTGAGHQVRAAQWATLGNHLALLFGIVPISIALLGTGAIESLGVAPEIVPFAEDYLAIRLLGSAFVFLAYVGDAYFRGLGDTLTPMLITIAANTVNVGLDVLLIFGFEPLGVPAMGVRGAAWATVIAMLFHASTYVVIAGRRRARGKAAPRYLARSTFVDAKEFLRVGVPSGLYLLVDIGAMTFFAVAVARLGAVETAANVIALTIVRTSFMPGYGVSMAAQTLVGQYLGARDVPAARRTGWTSVAITSVYMGAMALLFLVFRHQIVGFFSSDPEVLRFGSRLLIWGALFQFGDGVSMVLSGALRGAGDTRYVMLVGLAAGWLVFVPLTAVLLVLGWGAEGGWIAFNAWVAIACVLVISRFRSDVWTSYRLDVESIHAPPDGAVVRWSPRDQPAR